MRRRLPTPRSGQLVGSQRARCSRDMQASCAGRRPCSAGRGPFSAGRRLRSFTGFAKGATIVTLAPIDCRSAMRELWDYLDNKLPSDRTEQIRVYLSICIGCQEHVQFSRALLQQIELPLVPPAAVADLRHRVRDALRRDGLAVAR